ncbi:hypothetical protein [Streptosporangium roseum]|uniref:hypothetical protein n=1 Tax=Streptosporangium roseum TaxID=2001 RepID=UPI0004CD132F|nr:hypothetical protein [Streptosporangium roseum]
MRDKSAAERETFFFTDDDLGYEAWMGVPSLPTFDWSSERLPVLAARAAHRPVRIPLAARSAVPVYGGAETALSDDGTVTLPADGPALHIWRLTWR